MNDYFGILHVLPSSPSWNNFVLMSGTNNNYNNNSVALVRKRTLLTQRPPLVDKVSANFCL
jgi:hypothetical protein